MYVRKRLIIAGTALSASLLTLLSPAGPGGATQSIVSTVKARWCFTALPLPARYDSATASDVNNHGLVVGTAYTADGQSQSVAWWHGKFRILHDRGAESSTANAVNDRGVVAGAADGYAVVWRKGRMHRLGGDGGVANDINNHGTVVGNSGDQWQPTVWRRHKATLLPGAYSVLLGIDNAGLMVGHDGVWPQVWRHGMVEFLDFPPDFEFGQASAVNNGVIVGEGDDGGTYAVPVVWRDLKPRVLPFRREVDDAAWARDVNDHGLIVGGKSPAHSTDVPVVWVHGRYQVLPSPVDDLGAWATAVSDTRLIVGGWGSPTGPRCGNRLPAAGCSATHRANPAH